MPIGAMNHPARNPIEEIEWIGQHGFDFVDFTLEPPAADPGRIDPQAIRNALEKYNLDVVAHTVYDLPISSPFAGVLQAALEEFRQPRCRCAQRRVWCQQHTRSIILLTILRGKISRSTLADANRSRGWRIFADFAQGLIHHVRQLNANEPWAVTLSEILQILSLALFKKNPIFEALPTQNAPNPENTNPNQLRLFDL